MWRIAQAAHEVAAGLTETMLYVKPCVVEEAEQCVREVAGTAFAGVESMAFHVQRYRMRNGCSLYVMPYEGVSRVTVPQGQPSYAMAYAVGDVVRLDLPSNAKESRE